jgi:hypothetical protein
MQVKSGILPCWILWVILISMMIFGRTGKKGSQKSMWPFGSKGIRNKVGGRKLAKRIASERMRFDRLSK